jgi:hypothetical protein
MLERLNILIARTCAYQAEHPALGNWLFETGVTFGKDNRVGDSWTVHDVKHRIHTSRNSMARWAIDNKVDYLCFVDSDMAPDYRVMYDALPKTEQPNARPWARPFIKSTLDFMLTHPLVGVVASPAVSGPPTSKINVWIPDERGPKPHNLTHEEYAALKPCFMPVRAIGTGLMMIDVKVFNEIEEPWFDDIYYPGSKMYDADISQDCAFCFKVAEAGFGVYANLFAPAKHMKIHGYEVPDFGV